MKKYPKYKASGVEWIGDIPEKWQAKKFKLVFHSQKGRTPKTLLSESNLNTDIYLAMDYLRENPKQIFHVDKSESVTFVDDGDILLLWDGSNAGEFIKSKKGVLSSTMAKISSNTIAKKYSWFFLKSYERLLRDFSIGMGIPHVNGNELRNCLIPIPSLEEQTQIANYLDYKTKEIETLIINKQMLIELLQEERTATINHSVTKGINPKVKLKPSGIEWLGDIPENWEVTRLANLGTFLKGRGVSKADLTEEGVSVILYGDIYTKYNIVTSSIERKTSKEIAINSVRIYNGDLLFTASGETKEDIGKCICFTGDQEAYAGGDVVIFRQQKNVSLYLSYLFNSYHIIAQKAKLSKGEIVVHIYESQLRNIPFALPSKKEQSVILNHIEIEHNRINTIISKTKQEIELLKEYKTALISEVVTGKVDVRDEKIK